MSRRSLNQSGLTIVELMISTAVFTTILLVILTAITQIGRMYYKGVTTAKTQETARSLIDRLSQEIQYSGTSTSPVLLADGNKRVLCIGSSRFFFMINQEKDSSNYGIWADESNDGSVSNACVAPASTNLRNTAVPTTATLNAREMLGDGMRIVRFDLTNPTPNLYTIDLRITYGADDLLDSVDPTTGSLVDQNTFPQYSTCKGATIGTQFCSMSELSVTVSKRL
jgi:Tfp pilus assembly protein PilW